MVPLMRALPPRAAISVMAPNDAPSPHDPDDALSPDEAVRRVVLAAHSKQASRLSATRKNNSERARRYRKRKKERIGHTVGEVETLRKRVEELCARRQLYEERLWNAPFAASNIALKLVQEYFSVFRYGMPLSPSSSSALTPSRRALDVPANKQELFLERIAHPDVMFNEFIGVHPLIDQWRKYSHFHTSVRLEFVSFRMRTIDNCPIVSTCGVLHVGYSRKTLENLFPHVLAREDMVQKLVGKELHLRYHDDFYFNERGQMIKYDLTPDLVGALQEVVGNLHDVALLLGDAMIEQGAVIRQELRREDEDDERGYALLRNGGANSPSCVMDIDFILS
uniref:BZIP domain-containing protein n=1 Tax=Globisporangium ultimum (strain ATCC 200006 / CBS 805.95 / DAOM BR144) TaxID=431595 RepID=K3WNT8_GLOUD